MRVECARILLFVCEGVLRAALTGAFIFSAGAVVSKTHSDWKKSTDKIKWYNWSDSQQPLQKESRNLSRVEKRVWGVKGMFWWAQIENSFALIRPNYFHPHGFETFSVSSDVFSLCIYSEKSNIHSNMTGDGTGFNRHFTSSTIFQNSENKFKINNH